jgi:hypothetical protein
MSAFDEVIEQLGWSGLKRSQAQDMVWSAENAFEAEVRGAGRDGFFQPCTTYVHPGEGRFYVEFVGTAPEGFEHHSETQGVAFGWRVGVDGEPSGSYCTPDFAGWLPEQRRAGDAA